MSRLKRRIFSENTKICNNDNKVIIMICCYSIESKDRNWEHAEEKSEKADDTDRAGSPRI